MSRVLWSIACLSLFGVACGDDTKPSDSGVTDAATLPDQGKDAGAKDAGKAPARDSGTTMTMTAAPVKCGSTMCSPPAGAASLLGSAAGAIPGGAGALGAAPMPVACCVDPGAGKCGVSAMEGAACEPMAERDTRCASVDLGALQALVGNMGFGCCTSKGTCGIDGAVFGRGCVDNAEASSMINMAGVGAFLMVPPPGPCSAGGGGTGGEGGAGGSGGTGGTGGSGGTGGAGGTSDEDGGTHPIDAGR